MVAERIPPIHPGEILRDEFMDEMGISESQLETDTGIDREIVEGIISGNIGISEDTALRFLKRFGNSPEFWMNPQSIYESRLEKFNRSR